MTQPDLFAQVTQIPELRRPSLGHYGQSQASMTLSQNMILTHSARVEKYKTHLNLKRELTKM